MTKDFTKGEAHKASPFSLWQNLTITLLRYKIWLNNESRRYRGEEVAILPLIAIGSVYSRTNMARKLAIRLEKIAGIEWADPDINQDYVKIRIKVADQARLDWLKVLIEGAVNVMEVHFFDVEEKKY